MKPSIFLIVIAVAALAVAACGGSGNGPTSTIPNQSSNSTDGHGKHRFHHNTSPINHIFVIVQENRTVDNLFNGFPGANTQNYGMWGNQIIQLVPKPIATAADYPHTLTAFLTDTGCPPTPNPIPCPMNGFKSPNPQTDSAGAYVYVPQSYTEPYWDMAKQYAFGDNMFQSNLDASFVSHQYLVAAQANSATDFPDEQQGCGGTLSPTVPTITQQRAYGPTESACFDYKTIGKELYNGIGALWRYYEAAPGTGIAWWRPFIWIPDQSNWPGGTIVDGPSKFINDIQNPNGYNATVTWITPTLKNSDHSGGTTNHGPDWVAAVVNAIGTSQYWNSSVIFITWDDWGGWYDHVSPPYRDYDGLGVRVPFIIISPYTKKGLVTHTVYEQASILKYIEDLFGLATLSAADARANDPAPDVMSNGNDGAPRPFATISANAYSSPDDPGDPDTDQPAPN